METHYCMTLDDSIVRGPADTTEMISQKQIRNLRWESFDKTQVHIVHSVTSACHWQSGNWSHIALPSSRITYQQKKNETNHGAKILTLVSTRTLVRRHELGLVELENA